MTLSIPGGLRTPLEPAARRAAAAAAATRRQSLHATPLGRIEAAVSTSCGSLHAGNEDAHSPLGREQLMFVVADGVGGGAMAQLASQQLVAYLHEMLGTRRPDAEGIRQAVQGADRAIAQRIAMHTERPGAATVVLCAPVNALASRWLIGWVGDCRAYRLSGDAEPRVELLTRDDTFRNLGEQPPAGGSPDDPARMVGNGAVIDASVVRSDFACGDVLALCSDGVHKHLGAGDWRRVLTQRVPLGRRCDDLIDVARANGSADDATVLLLERSLSWPTPPWSARKEGTT